MQNLSGLSCKRGSALLTAERPTMLQVRSYQKSTEVSAADSEAFTVRSSSKYATLFVKQEQFRKACGVEWQARSNYASSCRDLQVLNSNLKPTAHAEHIPHPNKYRVVCLSHRQHGTVGCNYFMRKTRKPCNAYGMALLSHMPGTFPRNSTITQRMKQVMQLALKAVWVGSWVFMHTLCATA